MTNVANTYGSMGEYDKSNSISLRTMRECIYCYRMNALVLNLYSITWNHGECKKKNIPIFEGYQEKDYLYKCIALCQMNKNIAQEKTVKNRFKNL